MGALGSIREDDDTDALMPGGCPTDWKSLPQLSGSYWVLPHRLGEAVEAASSPEPFSTVTTRVPRLRTPLTTVTASPCCWADPSAVQGLGAVAMASTTSAVVATGGRVMRPPGSHPRSRTTRPHARSPVLMRKLGGIQDQVFHPSSEGRPTSAVVLPASLHRCEHLSNDVHSSCGHRDLQHRPVLPVKNSVCCCGRAVVVVGPPWGVVSSISSTVPWQRGRRGRGGSDIEPTASRRPP